MKSSILIGGSSATLATAVPDAVLPYAGKFLFAVVTSVVATVLSHFIKKWLEGRKAAKESGK